MKYASSVLDLIGNTPLVRLNSVTEGIEATVLVKLEYLNPGGSVKDRIAAAMIDDAEASGALTPGGTIVEPTSGNTGVGLALVAQQRGYKSVFVTPDKVGVEKRDVLRAYGAQVAVVSTSVAPDSAESYYGVSDALAEAIEGGYKPDQFNNPAAPRAHYETTGPEIWRDTDGRITHFVCGAGTGGTVTGTGRFLKEASADRPGGPVKVIVSDPEGSVYSGGAGTPYFVEGVGEDMWPDNYDPSIPDEVLAVTDAESFEMTRRLAREEGLLVGGSSGMAVAGALRAARDLPADAVMVVLLPDSGRGYLGKVFNDDWMRSRGFALGHTPELPHVPGIIEGDGAQPAVGAFSHSPLPQTMDAPEAGFPAASPETLLALLAERGRVLDPAMTLADACDVLAEGNGAGGAGVVGPRELPAALGSVKAVVTGTALRSLLLRGQASLETTLGEIIAAQPWSFGTATLGTGQPATALLDFVGEGGGFVLAHEGRAVAVYTVAEALAVLTQTGGASQA